MKLVFIALLLFVSRSEAFYLGQTYTEKGEINLGLLCDGAETRGCEELCNESLACQFPEPSCVNCSGTEDVNLRVMLTRWSYFYQITNQPLKLAELLPLLKSNRVAMLDRQTVYNFHRGFGSVEVFENMGKVCGKNENDFHLIVQLSEQGTPERLLGLVCDSFETTITTPLRVNLRGEK